MDLESHIHPMPHNRETLIQKREQLLSQANAESRWNQQTYDEIQELTKQIEALPVDPPPPVRQKFQVPKKGR